MPLHVGDPAPPFSAQTDEGRTLSLDDLGGRRIVLYFYSRADTAG